MNNNDIDLIKKYVPIDKQEEALEKLKSGYPVQYIIGNVEFLNTIINVDERALIPRFETEYLVNDLIKYIQDYNFINPKILEIGVGSGCISIALNKNVKSDITGIDVSNDAICLAKENAFNNNVNINFINESVETFFTNDKYDVIVSNPPYVRKDEYVSPSTKFEPQNALFPGDNEYYFYELILRKFKDNLNKRFIIAFEIGSYQADYISSLAKKSFSDSIVIVKNDLNNFNRYIYIINE